MPVISPRTVEVTIYQGNDLAELRRLSEAIDFAETEAKGAPARKSAKSPAVLAAEAYDAFVTEAAERAETIKLQQVGRKRWREVRDACPPRKDNEGDEFYGFNPEAVAEELMQESIVEPAMTAPELDMLSDADWERLTDALIAVNTAQVADPKAVSAVSVLDRMNAESSKQLDPSA